MIDLLLPKKKRELKRKRPCNNHFNMTLRFRQAELPNCEGDAEQRRDEEYRFDALRMRRDDLRSLALRAGSCTQTRRLR